MEPRQPQVRLFLGPSHDCNYLPGRESAESVLEPGWIPDSRQYARLLAMGFRRSGAFLYQPRCPHCQACVAARLAVREFRPNRSQRRCLKLNRDVGLRSATPNFCDEYFDLYQRYLAARHPQGGMDNPKPDQFLEFLNSHWSDTWFHELRLGQQLIGVAVTDQFENGMSAVYTFYEPGLRSRGLGTYAVLAQIELARRLGLPYLYLGYWIGDCDKMSYKERFRPLELLLNGVWHRIEVGQAMPDSHSLVSDPGIAGI